MMKVQKDSHIYVLTKQKVDIRHFLKGCPNCPKDEQLKFFEARAQDRAKERPARSTEMQTTTVSDPITSQSSRSFKHDEKRKATTTGYIKINFTFI